MKIDSAHSVTLESERLEGLSDPGRAHTHCVFPEKVMEKIWGGQQMSTEDRVTLRNKGVPPVKSWSEGVSRFSKSKIISLSCDTMARCPKLQSMAESCEAWTSSFSEYPELVLVITTWSFASVFTSKFSNRRGVINSKGSEEMVPLM